MECDIFIAISFEIRSGGREAGKLCRISLTGTLNAQGKYRKRYLSQTKQIRGRYESHKEMDF